MDVTNLTSLPGLVSTDRFETYLEAVSRDSDRALRLYCWNIEASGAWWGPFHVLEVAVRNSTATTTNPGVYTLGCASNIAEELHLIYARDELVPEAVPDVSFDRTTHFAQRGLVEGRTG